MTELIPISTGGPGLPVESARALYDFLGFEPSQWNRWAKKNIVGNPYAQPGVDWEVSDSVSKRQGGRPSVDYRLSIDFAKRLSMLARTKKGEAIRQYFLDCEAALSPAGLQMATRLSALEKQVSQLQQQQLFRLQADPVPLGYPMAVETTRARIARMVTQYAEAMHKATFEIWNKVWLQLQVVYGFNVRAQRKSNYENLLDVAERYGQMERIHALLTTEFILPND